MMVPQICCNRRNYSAFICMTYFPFTWTYFNASEKSIREFSKNMPAGQELRTSNATGILEAKESKGKRDEICNIGLGGVEWRYKGKGKRSYENEKQPCCGGIS